MWTSLPKPYRLGLTGECRWLPADARRVARDCDRPRALRPHGQLDGVRRRKCPVVRPDHGWADRRQSVFRDQRLPDLFAAAARVSTNPAHSARQILYIRRAFRILPAALLYLAVMTTLALARQILVSKAELAGSLFFFRNYLGQESGFYTAHFWLLSLEEQFYIRPDAPRWFAGPAAAVGCAMRSGPRAGRRRMASRVGWCRARDLRASPAGLCLSHGRTSRWIVAGSCPRARAAKSGGAH